MGIGEDRRDGTGHDDLLVRVAAYDAGVLEEKHVAPACARIEERVKADPVEVDRERPRPVVDLGGRQATHARLLQAGSRRAPSSLHISAAGGRRRRESRAQPQHSTDQAAVDDGIPHHGAHLEVVMRVLRRE
jgi:hypothetical protein